MKKIFTKNVLFIETNNRISDVNKEGGYKAKADTKEFWVILHKAVVEIMTELHRRLSM